MAICEKSGLEFVERSARQKTHPVIRSWIDKAARDGWRYTCLLTLERGKQAGVSTLEEFVALLEKEEKAWQEVRSAQISQRNEAERQAKEAKRQRFITNRFLSERNYRWHRHENDEEDIDFFNAPEVEYTLYSPDHRAVSVQEAMLELAWQGVKFAKEWLAEHNITEEMPAIEKQREAERKAAEEKEAQRAEELRLDAEEEQQYQREAIPALIDAGFSQAEATAIATRWSKRHSPNSGYVLLGLDAVLDDGRQAALAFNDDLRYIVMIHNEWCGIDEVLALPGVPEKFREQLVKYARRNSKGESGS